MLLSNLLGKPSDTFHPPRTDEEGNPLRRSSVWSVITPSPGSSPEGRRGSFFDLFKKGKTNEENNSSSHPEPEEPITFRDVEFGEKK